MRTTESRNLDFATVDGDLLGIALRGLDAVDMPSIVEFAEHPHFLGKRLYPRQKSILRLICLETENMTAYDIDVINQWAEGFYDGGVERIGISPDVWERVSWLKERGYPHFREVINISGRRSSKGYIGAVMTAYNTYRLLQRGNPQAYYGVDEGKELYQYVTATGLAQAKAYQFSDISNAIRNSPAFQPYLFSVKPSYLSFATDADRMRMSQLAARGVILEDEIASIIILAVSANSSAARGGAAYSVIFDEMAHMLIGTEGSRTAEAVYKAITPSLGQMGRDAFIYVPTSPLTKVGKAYDLYNQGLLLGEDGRPSNPDMLVIQLPSWFTYEDWDNPEATNGRPFKQAFVVYDEGMKLQERRDADSFRVEWKAQWAEVIDAWLNPRMVDRMFEPVVDVHGSTRELYETEAGVLKWVYRGHADPAKSAANFAAVIGHSEPMVDEEGETWDHVFIDKLMVWKAEEFEDHQYDYAQIEEELAEEILKYPAMRVFSYDQYGSFITVPQMRERLRKAKSRTNVVEVTFTGPSNKKRCEVFKSALGMDWVHSYKDPYGLEGDSLLSQELKFLQEKNGVVDHQKIGPITTDDLADALMVVVEALVGDQLERLKKRRILGSTPLAMGAPGGYHSGTAPDDGGSQARQMLNKNSRATASRGAGYGVNRGRRR